MSDLSQKLFNQYERDADIRQMRLLEKVRPIHDSYLRVIYLMLWELTDLNTLNNNGEITRYFPNYAKLPPPLIDAVKQHQIALSYLIEFSELNLNFSLNGYEHGDVNTLIVIRCGNNEIAKFNASRVSVNEAVQMALSVIFQKKIARPRPQTIFNELKIKNLCIFLEGFSDRYDSIFSGLEEDGSDSSLYMYRRYKSRYSGIPVTLIRLNETLFGFDYNEFNGFCIMLDALRKHDLLPRVNKKLRNKDAACRERAEENQLRMRKLIDFCRVKLSSATVPSKMTYDEGDMLIVFLNVYYRFLYLFETNKTW